MYAVIIDSFLGDMAEFGNLVKVALSEVVRWFYNRTETNSDRYDLI